MDFSMIGAATSAITASKELAKAAIGIRDFNEIAPKIAELNNQLLKAQDALFTHQAQLLTLQNEQFETAKELAKLKEALAQKGSYSLFELSAGVLVYRVNISPVEGHVSDPASTQPLHYVCQSCFDKGIKVVLKRVETWQAVGHYCSGCKENYLESKKPSAVRAPAARTPSTRWATDW